MKKLAAAKVWRSGQTSRTWNSETDEVELDIEGHGLLQLTFSLRSKGGGVTEVKVTIGPKDFAALASAMVSADRVSALRDLAATLATEMTRQADNDKATIQRARNSVFEAADSAFREAPEGRDHAERLTRDMVYQLVQELNKADVESGDSDED